MPPTETLEEIRKAGRERLYPSVTNPNWLVLRKRRDLFRRWLSELFPGRSLVLDVGGRVQPYRPLIPDARYIAIDLRTTPVVTVVANAWQIPFPYNTFDLAQCTQMLEYAPDPGAVISEIHR